MGENRKSLLDRELVHERNERKVRNRHPDAEVMQNNNPSGLTTFIVKASDRVIGLGVTEREAWENARLRIEHREGKKL